MKIKNQGFTLVELLVTILIISILATYSVLAYRNSVFESENKYAKAKMEVINAGIDRFEAEYPGTSYIFSSEDAIKFGGTDVPCRQTEGLNKGKFYPSPDALIACGFVPKMDFSADSMKYDFFLTKAGAENNCAAGTEGETSPCVGWVYMRPKDGAKTGKDENYCACIDRRGRAYDGE